MKKKIYIGVMKGTEHYNEPVTILVESLDHWDPVCNYRWFVTEVEIPLQSVATILAPSEVKEVADADSSD